MMFKDTERYKKERVAGKISLIVPVYKTEAVLDRCLKSILSQSYDLYEIIVVFDGDTQFNTNKYATEERIKFIGFSENHGVCFARNAGMELSDGEFISCFSSDFEMKVGCLGEWIKAFAANPDCEFVYGGYELMEDANQNFKGAVFSSEPFNPEALETHNYIDGGFPVRADKVPMWDESFKSLNDWEWSLHMVKTLGYKGFYLSDFISYAAEPPKAGGLSNHSHNNWEEIYTRIAAKHKITVPDMNIISLTAPFHAARLAKLLGCHSNNLAITKKYPYKRIHLLGCFESNIEAWANVVALYGADKVSLHFIGSDVRQMFEQFPPAYSSEVKRLVLDKVRVFSESKRISDILKYCNIKSEVLPLPVIKPTINTELPEGYKRKVRKNKEFTIGVYSPGDSEKYTTQLMVQLALALPMCKFLFFGNTDGFTGRSPHAADNIEFTGWIEDMTEIYSQIDCLIRITPFDGVPISAIEAMMCGIPVIHNHDLPGVIRTEHENNIARSPSIYHTTLNELVDLVFKLMRKEKIAKTKFYSGIYSVENFKKTLEA